MAAGIGGKAHQGTDGSPPDDAGNSPFSSSDHEGKLSILLHLTEQHHYSGFHTATDRWIIIYCKKRTNGYCFAQVKTQNTPSLTRVWILWRALS